ncbi:MAG: TonB-dependent receptor, partial [Bacteroidota bacterium]
MFQKIVPSGLLIVLCLCASVTSFAQSIIKIIDQTTQQRLSGVIIEERWTNSQSGKLNIIKGETNALGEYELHSELTQYEGQIFIMHINYQPRKVTSFELLNKGYTISLTPAQVHIDEIVVSATKFEEPYQKIPRQIEVIKARDIAFANQQNTADLLQNSGQVFVQKSQMGGGSIVMRGFEANKTLFVVDGIRMNNAIYRGGHLQNVLRIDQNMLQQTELLFGPGAVMYGSDAMGGVMHFTTLQPKHSASDKLLFNQHASYRYGSVNTENTAHYDINIGSKKWASLTSVSAAAFGDMKQGDNRSADMGTLGLRDSVQARVNGTDVALANSNHNLQAPTAYKQLDVMQKLRFSPSAQISHTLNLQLSTSTDVPRYDRLTEKKSGIFSSAEWYYGPETRILAAYHLELKQNTQWYDQVNITGAYQYIEESRHNRNFGSITKTNRNEFVHVYSANADFVKRNLLHTIQYGLEGTFNNIRSNANRENITTGAINSQSTRYPDGGSTMVTAAAYLSHSWRITPSIILSEGVRYSFVQLDATFKNKSFYSFLPDALQQRNQALNGQIGLVYLPGKDWKLSTSLSSGFRAPNVDDVGKIFDSQSGLTAIIPNSQLKPENIYTAEIGIGKAFAKKIKVEVNAYYSMVTDIISIKRRTVNGGDSIVYNGVNTLVVQNQNGNKAYVYGTSITLAADITKNISLTNTFNYTFGRIHTDSSDYPLDHIPPVFGRSAIQFSANRIQSEFFVLYNGWKHIEDYYLKGEDNEQYATMKGMPSWYTLNIRIGYTYPIKQQYTVQAQVGCENILDRNYRTFASGFSAPGRNLYATLR